MLELCDTLASHAPVTMRVTKEALRRLRAAGLPDGDDLVREAYASQDFRDRVAAFLAKALAAVGVDDVLDLVGGAADGVLDLARCLGRPCPRS